MSQYIFNINEDEGDFAVGKCELNLPSVLHFINCEKMVNKNQEKTEGGLQSTAANANANSNI